MRFFLIFLFLVTTMFAKAPRGLHEIIKSGYIEVGVYYQDIYPFFMKNKEGQLTGYDIDMALEIGKELGVKVIFNREATTFSGLVNMVVEGTVDVAISELSATLQRATNVMFSTPYVVLNHGIFFNRMSMAKLKNQHKNQWKEKLASSEIIIATRRDTAYETYVKNTFSHAQIVTFVEWEEVIDAVIRGEADCAYYDEVEIKKLIQQQPNLALKGKAIIVKDKADPIAMAVNQQNMHLLQWLNLYLAGKEKVTPDSLLEKYRKELP
ncbi:substrate-binding periplasmic protein [Sulfurospirillum barnesii]|uniref:Periplasmic component of amino acid ABC-type transporter/signal transduction system n=1 Tax=Sulfurospirillum barnesii (strain ATCC 700032 / DSM 10660 / SES-3) TaxID=760154 RepID=I3XVT3_SULBS|nr:ABC transporter substrate-binding protein [Sulfurospirillum barnesii]AFL68057.1 periplasmic component of amino acid ABC-type transporter/signal transduction system [Sulfurospirillum barnesii SES-3]